MTPAQCFGKVLRDARERAKLSQEALADMAGLDRTYVSLLERGRRQPSLTTMLALSTALEVRFSVFAGRIEEAVAPLTTRTRSRR